MLSSKLTTSTLLKKSLTQRKSLMRQSKRSYATTIPKDTTFFTSDGKVTAEQIFKGKKVVLVGIPGAFTQVCTNSHIPGFVKNAEKLKEKGVDEVVCVSVNDHYVMKAWAEKMNVEGKVRMLADPDGTFTRAVGHELDLTNAGLGKRSTRYAMYVEDGKIVKDVVEKSPADLDVTSAEKVLESLDKK